MSRIQETLGLPQPMWREMVEQARREWPFECCGIVTGSKVQPGTELRLHPCRNVYEEMKKQDPVTFTRDAHDAFLIDPAAQLAIERQNREQGRDYYIFYHSHAQCDAYFSAEDKAAAVFPFDEPNHPEARHLVLSIWDRRLKEAFWCRWDEGTRDFPGEKESFEPA